MANVTHLLKAKDPRPVLMTFDKVHDLQVANVTLIQSPFWHFFVRDTTNALFYDLSLRSLSNSSVTHTLSLG